MRRRSLAAVLAAAAVFLCSSCNADEAVDAEIKIPILGADASAEYETAVVSVGDITETSNVAGSIGYIYADQLLTDFESNILEYYAERGQKLKEGDPIAVFDSSALDYEIGEQKILADNAYASYAASGGEAARLEYEIQAKKLEYLQYQKDQFTIRAPYDCVVITAVHNFEIGTVIPEGTLVCTIAKENEIYVYTNENVGLFRVGMPVKAKFGASDEYDFHVVMTPEPGGRRGELNSCVVLQPDEGVLEKILTEVDNVISAGWATLIVPTVQKYGVMTLPEDAVKGFSGSTYCSVLDNGRRVRVPVEIGGVYGGKAVILSGLSEGDEVAY